MNQGLKKIPLKILFRVLGDNSNKGYGFVFKSFTVIITFLSIVLINFFVWNSRLNQNIRAQECGEIECELEEVDPEDDPAGEKAREAREEYLSCIEDKKQCWENKVAEVKTQANTLESAIKLLNGQIILQELRVSQTKANIIQLENEINNLEERIIGLGITLDKMAQVLIERIQQSYKDVRQNKQALLFFSSQPIENFLSRKKYIKLAQLHTVKLMQKAEYQRIIYDEQKQEKEIKQEELEKKRDELIAQQAELASRKQEKQSLLQETQNDEQRYQQLLAEAIAELNSFKSFTRSQVGDEVCLASSPGQTDGWFWSQRDPRWCKQHIAYSNEIIGEVGCLLSSVAMIWTTHGHTVNPSQVAANSSYFSLRTAYMRHPLPSPPGYKYLRRNWRDIELIDSELAAGRPVIVHLSIGTQDGHFVVLKSGSNGNYVMNDPLQGSNLRLGDYYSSTMIDSVRAFQPS